jgi:hypothetical protein
MAIVLVSSTNITPGANGGITSAINTTGANLLIISISSYDPGGAVTVSDSNGNTYIPLGLIRNGPTRSQILYSFGTIFGSGHTFTATGIGVYPVIIAYAFSGVTNYHSESTNIGTTVSNLASGNLTPSANGALIFTNVCGQNAVTDSISGGYALTTRPFSGGNNMQGSAAWLIQTIAATINPTWTFSPNQGSTCVGAAVFLPIAVTTIKERTSLSVSLG